MPEPSTTEGRHVLGEFKNHLEDAAVRRVESSASRRQVYPLEPHAATSRFIREASVYTGRSRNTAPAAPGYLGNEHHRRDPGGQDSQLEQIREMQARLDEGAGTLEQFRRNIR